MGLSIGKSIIFAVEYRRDPSLLAWKSEMGKELNPVIRTFPRREKKRAASPTWARPKRPAPGRCRGTGCHTIVQNDLATEGPLKPVVGNRFPERNGFTACCLTSAPTTETPDSWRDESGGENVASWYGVFNSTGPASPLTMEEFVYGMRAAMSSQVT